MWQVVMTCFGFNSKIGRVLMQKADMVEILKWLFAALEMSTTLDLNKKPEVSDAEYLLLLLLL
jgi:hypothetical protein